jgi:hypothetical protein
MLLRRCRATLLLVTTGGFILCPGCVENGLSVRETPGHHDFSRYAMSLYEAPPGEAGPRRPLVLPARIAVAQIGEVTPPQAMLEALRKDKQAFAIVQSVPATPEVAEPWVSRPNATAPGQQPPPPDDALKGQAAHMLRYTRDIGADYLFLFGGTIDHATTGTGLSLADVTIVGAFTVPSKRISAEGRASGILIDARSGRVVLAVGASQSDSRLAPSAAQASDELKLLTSVRDALTTQLAEQLKARAHEVADGAKPTT